jgi:hypothetical protein
MARSSPLQSNFGAGEFSPLAYGRVDHPRYNTGLATCLNYNPTIQGGLIRRPGTKFAAEVKNSSLATRVVNFEFSVTQAYIIEFGNLYIRIFKDNASVTLTTQAITDITKASTAVVTYTGADTYANGDRILITGVLGMAEVNNREFTVANVNAGANTFELSGINSTTYTTYVSGGTIGEIYEVVTPYLTADLFTLKFTQSADVLYITHPSYAPRKLTRTGHTAWTLSTITFLDGPYLATNTTTTTLTPSAATGAGVTITASAVTGINSDTGFQTTDVGRLIRLQQGTIWGYVLITARATTTSIMVTVINTLTNTNAKTNWRLGVWSDTTGYPSCSTFHEDRLVFGGALGAPLRLDASNSGDYENYAPSGTDGTVIASNALAFTLNSNGVNNIRWLISDEKGLFAGTVAGEWIIRSSNLGEALTPTSINAQPTTFYGSANLQAIHSGKAAVFVQRTGHKVRELNYFFDVDGFQSSDLTEISEHITQGGIVDSASMTDPQSLLWYVRSDGVLISSTYERAVDSLRVGWARHILGGVSDALGNNAIVESVAIIPSVGADHDEVWLVVKRYINGSTKRFIEYMTPFFEDDDLQEEAFFLDAGLTLNNTIAATLTPGTGANVKGTTGVTFTAGSSVFVAGDVDRYIHYPYRLNGVNYKSIAKITGYTSGTVVTATIQVAWPSLSVIASSAWRMTVTTVTGLFHLEGETVSILADGAVLTDEVVVLGAITLASPASLVHVGYNYNSDGQLLRPESGAQDGTAIGKTRRINRVAMMLHRTLGLKIGKDFDNLDEVIFRTSADAANQPPGLFSGIISETVSFDYDMDNQFCWRQDQPTPGMILAIAPQLTIQDRL